MQCYVQPDWDQRKGPLKAFVNTVADKNTIYTYLIYIHYTHILLQGLPHFDCDVRKMQVQSNLRQS